MSNRSLEAKTGGSPLWREIKRNKVAYAYISPFFILFGIFGLFPIVSGFVISFFSWDGLSPMKFIWLKNYIEVLTTRLFWTAMYNTVYIGLISHVFILFGGLVLAYILNAKIIKRENVFKTVYFLPMVTSAVAVTIVFKAMFSYNSGIINYAFELLGLPRLNWTGEMGQYIKPAIITMFSWKWIGWNMVIYLAGMQGISLDVYEAATIDGASHRNMFFRITLPLLRPIILFTMIQSTIGMMGLFTEPFVLTNNIRGGTGNQGMTVMMFLLDKAPYNNNLYGFASATAYVISFVIILISILNINTVGQRDDAGAEGRLRAKTAPGTGFREDGNAGANVGAGRGTGAGTNKNAGGNAGAAKGGGLYE